MSASLFPTRRVGDVTITAISDGYLAVGLDALSNIDSADVRRMQDEAGITDPAAVHINCYLVRTGGRTVLIDAGAGGIRQWGGHLGANLRKAGVDPSEVDAVLLTHAHPDHVGGLIATSGEAAFPNAELVVHHREIAFWQDDGHLSRAGERARGNFQVARQVFDGYRDRLRVVDAGEVLPAITAMPLPGHTAGHTGLSSRCRRRQPAGLGRHRPLSADSGCPSAGVDRVRSGCAACGRDTIAAAGCRGHRAAADRRYASRGSRFRARHPERRWPSPCL